MADPPPAGGLMKVIHSEHGDPFYLGSSLGVCDGKCVRRHNRQHPDRPLSRVLRRVGVYGDADPSGEMVGWCSWCGDVVHLTTLHRLRERRAFQYKPIGGG